MRSQIRIILWGLVIVIIAVGTYYFLVSLGRHSEIAGPELQPRQPAADSPLPQTMPKHRSVVIPPVLEKKAGHAPSTVGSPSKQPRKVKPLDRVGVPSTVSPSSVPISRQQKQIAPHIYEQREKLQKIQSRLLKMIGKNHARIDIKQLDTVLAELAQFKDKNGLVGGVDIKALRQNLVVTGEIQKLSQQIQQEGKKPRGQVDMTRLRGDVQKLQELQKKLLPTNRYAAPALRQ